MNYDILNAGKNSTIFFNPQPIEKTLFNTG